MKVVTVEDNADRHLTEIYDYTLEQWGEAQAETYTRSLFETFEKIGAGRSVSRPIPLSLGVVGFVCAHRSHLIYWRERDDGGIGIVAILHQRMMQVDRLRHAFGGPN